MIVLEDGSVQINDVQNDFMKICELEKPMISESTQMPIET